MGYNDRRPRRPIHYMSAGLLRPAQAIGSILIPDSNYSGIGTLNHANEFLVAVAIKSNP